MENYHFEGIVKDADGNEYDLKYTTDERGFRAFGKLDSEKKKVFFIGDSFTQAIEVSDDKTYFSLIGDSLDLEVFAYGCRGFSTLQEIMAFEKHAPEIQPDLVVLQFCSNDFLNNFHELEQNSLYNNNRRRRPYLTDENEIEFKVPAKIGWDWLNERSLFFQFVFTRIERFLNSRAPEEENSEYHILGKGMAYPPYAEAAERTGRLLKLFSEKIPPGIPLLLFTTHQDHPHYHAISDLCQKLDIPFVGYIPAVIEESKECTLSRDGAHWNNLGHQIVADLLACEVAELLNMETEDAHKVLSLQD